MRLRRLLTFSKYWAINETEMKALQVQLEIRGAIGVYGEDKLNTRKNKCRRVLPTRNSRRETFSDC